MIRSSSGFTLIELMIAVTIVGILAMIALPSYRAYLIRGNRADAEQTLVRAAQAMERFAASNGASGYSGPTHLSQVPSVEVITQSPASGTAVYTLEFASTPTTTAFTITATPVATGINKDDGTLSISSTGAQTWVCPPDTTNYLWNGPAHFPCGDN